MRKENIIIGFMILGLVLSPYKRELAKAKSNIDGKALMTIDFTKEEKEAYEASYESAFSAIVMHYKEIIGETDSQEKKDIMLEIVDEIQNYDFDDLFIPTENKHYVIELPIRNASIIINGEDIDVDAEGKFTVPSDIVSNEESEVTIVTDDGFKIGNIKQKIDANKNKDIVYARDFEDLGKGIKNMSLGMEETSAEAAESQVFLPTLGKGSRIGKGVGETRVVTDSNIVVCNKHDSAVEYISAKDFAIQNSDCSRSVKLGILYLSDTSLFNTFWRGAYCVQESLTNFDGEGNSYCKGKKHKVHYNCSWFPGISHSEKFHIHRYK